MVSTLLTVGLNRYNSTMVLSDLDALFRETFEIERIAPVDASFNGIQVAREAARPIHRVACAVDACMETFRRAVEWEAELLFVHHGLFWGGNLPVVRSHYQRLHYLMEHDLGLYAVHLPLDIHPVLGNNAGIARRLDLLDTAPFGAYKGVAIGVKGRLESPLSLDEIIRKLAFDRDACPSVLPFGTNRISTVGIISGTGTSEVVQAVEEKLDLHITGDSSHTAYHFCLEESLNLLCGGHYQTETFGVRAVAEYLARETDVETTFIDVPTGL